MTIGNAAQASSVAEKKAGKYRDMQEGWLYTSHSLDKN
jgi:hypothetical protein